MPLIVVVLLFGIIIVVIITSSTPLLCVQIVSKQVCVKKKKNLKAIALFLIHMLGIYTSPYKSCVYFISLLLLLHIISCIKVVVVVVNVFVAVLLSISLSLFVLALPFTSF